MIGTQADPILDAVSYPYPIDRKRRKLRVAIVTGMLKHDSQIRKLPSENRWCHSHIGKAVGAYA